MYVQQPQFTIETLRQMREILGPPQATWITSATVLGSAFVGGLVSFIPNWLLENSKARRLMRNVDAALQAEVVAMIQIVNDRGYMADIDKVLAFLGDDETKHFALQVVSKDPVGPVYHQNLDKIGALNPIRATKFVRFYQLFESVALDFRPGGAAAIGAPAAMYKNARLLLQTALDLGAEIAGSGI